MGLATPAMSGTCTCVTEWTASPASAPLPCARIAPASSTTTARDAPRSDRSSPRLCIDMPLHLAPLERQRARLPAAEHLAVHAREEPPQPPFVGHREHDHAGPFLRRKAAIVEVVAIEGDERPTELARQAEVLDVAGAAQVVVLDHEEHVPAEPLAHVADAAERHVGV